jgi:hypothetical protein
VLRNLLLLGVIVGFGAWPTCVAGQGMEPPNPMQTKAPIGAPDFWPWDAAGVFARSEQTATTLVVYIDGNRCTAFSPQEIATDTPGSPLATLNRAYHEFQRNHLRWDDPLRNIAGQRRKVHVVGYDSSGHRSQTDFFTPITSGDAGLALNCDALRH